MSHPMHVLRNQSSRNDGSKYETQVMTLLASQWSRDKSIKDFWMVTSPLGIEKFDDIIAVVESTDGPEYVFMGQIKHSKKELNLKINNDKKLTKSLKSTKFDIPFHQYLQSYQNIISNTYANDDLKNILHSIPQENFYYFFYTPMTAATLTEVEIKEDEPIKYLDVCEVRRCFKWKRDVPEGYEELCQSLYFFVEQHNSEAIYMTLQDSILGERFTNPMIDTLCEFIDNHMLDGKYCSPLTKSIFRNKCLELLLSQCMNIEPIETRIKEGYFQFWDAIFRQYDVIIFDNIKSIRSLIYSYFEYKIRNLYDNFFNWNECYGDSLKVNIKIKTVTNNPKIFSNLLDVLRFMACQKDIPWVVEKQHNQLFYYFQDDISNGKFLISSSIEQDFISSNTKIFNSAHDLSYEHRAIIETINISLQGKPFCFLKDIIGGSVDILKAVRPSQLLRWTSEDGQYNTIGNKLTKVGEDYIRRTFSTTYTTITKKTKKSTKSFSEDQLIAKLKPEVLTVISNDPGMGKTTTLKSIALKTNPADYVISWNLGNSMADLDAQNPHLFNKPLDYFFSRCEGVETDQLVQSIFENHTGSNRLIMLIDSYDEMLPLYEEKILDIIQSLLKNTIRILITTRDHAEPLLKQRFLNINLVNLNLLNANDLKIYCKKYKITKELRRSFPTDFLKIPLHINMIRSVASDEHITTVCDLYEHFINEKLRLHFRKNTTPKNRQVSEIVRFLKIHKRIALIYTFSTNKEAIQDVFPDEGQDIVDYNSDLKAIGIISVIKDNEIQFAHRTYPEYLSAKWMLENKSKAKCLFNKVLHNIRYKYILKFLVQMYVAEHIHKWNLKFTDNSREMLEKDEWGLLPLQWSAMNVFFHKDKANIFECLLIHTLKTIPNANAFIDEYIQEEKYLTSQFWLKYVCYFGDHNLLMELFKISNFNVNYVIEYDTKCSGSILYNCCRYGNISKIKFLLSQGANPNLKTENGMTSLHTICRQSMPLAAKLLLDHGADPNLLNNEQLNSLHLACRNGNTAIVQLLLNFNADPNLKDKDGMNSLHVACLYKNNGVIDILLKHGMNPNLATHKGCTALHIACTVAKLKCKKIVKSRNKPDREIGHKLLKLIASTLPQAKMGKKRFQDGHLGEESIEMIQLLFKAGADPNLSRNDGLNCFEILKRSGLTEFIKFFFHVQEEK